MRIPHVLILLVLAAAACTTAAPSTRDTAPRGEIEELKARILELQRRATVNEVEIARLREKVAQLEAQLQGETPRGARRESARETPEAVTMTPGRIDEDDLDEELSRRPPASSPAPSSAPPSTQMPARPPASGEGASPPVEVPPVTPAAQALYDQGYTLYHQGRYLDAESTFQRFLQAHAATELGDNAQYWIGEARYARGDLRGALAAFRETVARFPEGNKVPDALLKAGQCLETLGDLEGARASYQELIRRFPETVAAVVARERMERLP